MHRARWKRVGALQGTRGIAGDLEQAALDAIAGRDMEGVAGLVEQGQVLPERLPSQLDSQPPLFDIEPLRRGEMPQVVPMLVHTPDFGTDAVAQDRLYLSGMTLEEVEPGWRRNRKLHGHLPICYRNI